jgi:flagellar biosynthetic protein FliQ
MTPESVVDLIRQTLLATFWLAAPLLAVGFLAGITVSLLQIVTSMQDNAFSTIPRLAVFLVSFVLLLPWMLEKLLFYTADLWKDLGRYAH